MNSKLTRDRNKVKKVIFYTQKTKLDRPFTKSSLNQLNGSLQLSKPRFFVGFIFIIDTSGARVIADKKSMKLGSKCFEVC